MVCLASLCAGCAGGSHYAGHWDGRRGYDGSGDYGYDLAASRSEARNYQALAARSYPAPGPPGDPWGPYIVEAAARFRIPERWIRAVMHQESGGRLYARDGSLTTSSAGAMGLMQVMPRTYDMLRQRYRLASDPYEPHDNILAGAAYLREMYDRFGSPAFVAAYNAGPDRLDAYLSGGEPLPGETVNYLASVAPNLGTEVAASGPLAGYAGGATAVGFRQTYTAEADRAFAGGGMTGQDYSASVQTASLADDPSARAFEGGGLVTPDAPTGTFSDHGGPDSAATPPPVPAEPEPAPTVTTVPLPAPSRGYPVVMRTPAAPIPALVPVAAAATVAGAWGIQVGAYPDPAHSRNAIAAARARGGALLVGAQPAITPVQHAGLLYRARLVGLTAETAVAACARLTGQNMNCFTVRPGS